MANAQKFFAIFVFYFSNNFLFFKYKCSSTKKLVQVKKVTENFWPTKVFFCSWNVSE